MSGEVDQDLVNEIWGSGPTIEDTTTNSNPDNVTVTNDDLWGNVTVETGDVDLPDPDAENTVDSVNENQKEPDVSSGGKGVLVKDDLWGDVTVESEEDDEQGGGGDSTVPEVPGTGDNETTTNPEEDEDRIYFDGPTSAD